MKICFICKENKEDNEFNFKDKIKGTLQSRCKECNKNALKKHYYENPQYYVEKRKRQKLEFKTKIYGYILEYFKSHPCVDCGESDPLVLEFDHVRDKTDCVSSLIQRTSNIDSIKEEIDKCEVRCANCHNRRHAIENKYMLYRLMNRSTASVT